MGGLNAYSQWYYLIYLVPGGTALLVLLLSVLGGGMHHGGAGHGHHVMGHGHRIGGHKGSGAKTQTQHRTGLATRMTFLLTFFGLGRVPAPLVWGSALLGWGLFGFWGTQFWQGVLHYPAAFALPSLATALAGAFVIEKATVETTFRYLPRDETYAVSAVEMCGLTGTAAFPIDAVRGRVHVYDTHGTLHDMSARTAPGQQATIARGSTILVADYDAVHDQVIVEAAL